MEQKGQEPGNEEKLAFRENKETDSPLKRNKDLCSP